MQLTRGICGRLGHHCRTKCALSGYHGGVGYGFGFSTGMGIDDAEEAEAADTAEEADDGDEESVPLFVVWLLDGPASRVSSEAGMLVSKNSGLIVLAISASRSGSDPSDESLASASLSTMRGKMNFFFSVLDGATCPERVGTESTLGSLVLYLWRSDNG